MAPLELRRKAKRLRMKCINRPIIVGAGPLDPNNDVYLEPEATGMLMVQFGLRVSKRVHLLAMLERKLGRYHTWHLQLSSPKGAAYMLKYADRELWPPVRMFLNDAELEDTEPVFSDDSRYVLHFYAPFLPDPDEEGITDVAAPGQSVLVETPK